MGFYINWTSILGLSVIILNNSQKLLKAILAKKKKLITDVWGLCLNIGLSSLSQVWERNVQIQNQQL